jgi:drug/metabolite transporter (DMT)-like permease
MAGSIAGGGRIVLLQHGDPAHPPTIAFFRALFGFLFLCTLVIRFREPVQFAAYRSRMGRLLVLGAFVSMTVSLYTYAIQHTTAANAALLVNSAPIYVAVLAPLALHEARARYTWASLGLAVMGMIFVSNPAELRLDWESLGGIAAAALSGFTYAFVMLIGRSLRGAVTGLTQTLWSNGLTALVLLPWALRGVPMQTVAENIPLLIPLGVFSLGLSYLLYFLGLQRIPAQVVSVVALLEPVSGALFGLVLFDEIPNALGMIGGGLILASIYLISRP